MQEENDRRIDENRVETRRQTRREEDKRGCSKTVEMIRCDTDRYRFELAPPGMRVPWD